MSTALSKFKQMANATNLDRAKSQAETALEKAKTEPLAAVNHNLAVLISALTALSAAANGVSFKGGVVGNQGSISYTDTYNRRNGTAPSMKLEFSTAGKPVTLHAYEGNGLVDTPDTIECSTQQEALGYLASFLGLIAPERATEIMPLIENAERAITNQAQLEGKSGRWTSRPVR
jgi:hypothetical protein